MNFPGRRGSAPRGVGLGPTYVRYLSLRMLIFLGVLAVCIVLGLKGLVAVLAALLISGVLSYPLARRQRDRIVREIQNRRS